jgi:diguanylate cyclase (GGDEF)-like protein
MGPDCRDHRRRAPLFEAVLRKLLAHSDFNTDELDFLSLPLIHEMVYRLFSLTTPVAMIPALLLSWEKQQIGIMFAQGLLGILVALHAFLLLRWNRRILSPFLMFSVSITLYIVAISRGEQFVLYFGATFTAAFYLLFERRTARYTNIAWIGLNCVLGFVYLPLQESPYFVGSLASTCLFIEVLFTILNRHETRLQRIAVRDPLTSALNRRQMMDDLDHAVAMCNRYGHHASIIMIDVDRFKPINDTFGHQEGDSVLVNLARTLTSRLRCTDRFYRYGGEEFVALVTATTEKQAAFVAASFCEQVRTSRLSSRAAVTISCGVAEVRPGDTAVEWVARGDAALYKAKSNGRDRVEVPELTAAAPRAAT